MLLSQYLWIAARLAPLAMTVAVTVALWLSVSLIVRSFGMGLILLKNKILKHKGGVLWAILLLLCVAVLYRYYAVYDPILMNVIADLIKAWFIYVVWYFSRELSSKSVSLPPLVYGRAVCVCALLAIMAWGVFGAHSEDGDPLFGGGDIVIDFAPTKDERNQHGWFIFLTLVIPSLIGVNKGLEDRGFRNPLPTGEGEE